MKGANGERIRTFCRLKPYDTCETPRVGPGQSGNRQCNRSFQSTRGIEYELLKPRTNDDKQRVIRLYPCGSASDPVYVSPYSPSNDFQFDDILREDASQEEVFEAVARPVLDSFLGGVNACICCYGQTGAGKTWTMSGSDTFQSRGLIQRTLESLFATVDSVSQTSSFSVLISYLEIYNEVAYDLLGVSDTETSIESFPRVTLQEDESGTLHTRNLTLHSVNNAEEAVDLFLYGNMNRIISSTAMNQASSRSHCILTIHMENRDAAAAGSAVVRSSKLHLVDLAGSERAWKTGLSDTNLREAKYINKSLHFLEQVVNSLYRKSAHIPYRNSVLTSVLRDSLGGNCKTVLIANVSLECTNLKESIATCRFAQRCGSVELSVSVNESVEWKDYADRLARENERLKQAVVVANPSGSFTLKPIAPDQFAFVTPIAESAGESLRNLQDSCGSNLSLFPKELRKRLVDAVRAEGMDYRVGCVGDLCALIQVLIAKLAQSDDEKRQLKEKLKSMVVDGPSLIALPTGAQWRRAATGIDRDSHDDRDTDGGDITSRVLTCLI